jgi:Xaa-Pro aminopeptidase
MISMEPVLKRGYTAWDQDVLPVDEYMLRQEAVRASLRAQDLKALVIVNYSLLGALFDYADIGYVGGLQTGGLIVVYHDADPSLVTFGGGRELFFTREQTWIEHVVPGSGRTFEVAQELLAARGITESNIAVAGLDGMPVTAIERFKQAFAGYDLEAFDSTLAAMRLTKRPRELMAIGIAKSIADKAAAAALEVFANGGDNTAAMLEAERVARFNKARDVRVLVNMNATELRPFEGRLAGRHAPLKLWVAAQYHGYWAETAVMSGGSDGTPARSAIDAMAAAIRSGASSSTIAEAGLGALPSELRAIALQYGLGGTVGLAQCDGIEIRPGNADKLPENAVVSLVCCALAGDSPSIASRLLQVTSSGANEVTAPQFA